MLRYHAISQRYWNCLHSIPSFRVQESLWGLFILSSQYSKCGVHSVKMAVGTSRVPVLQRNSRWEGEEKPSVLIYAMICAFYSKKKMCKSELMNNAEAEFDKSKLSYLLLPFFHIKRMWFHIIIIVNLSVSLNSLKISFKNLKTIKVLPFAKLELLFNSGVLIEMS